MTGQRFALRKWYLDGTAADGRAIIGYWSALRWRDLSVCWQSVTTYGPGRAPERLSSLRRRSEPVRRAGGVEWTSPALKMSWAIAGSVAPISARLWTRSAAGVDWCSPAPAGVARVSLEGQTFSGVGYAECLTLTVAPWRLPIRELWWGRWCDDAGGRSIVWIEWRGPETRRWVFLDGSPVDALVDESGVRGERFVLGLEDRETLEHRSVAEALEPVAALTKILPRSVRDMRESKWCSRGVLSCDGARITGRAIHEVVNFP
jgi:hypothetical protein